MKKSLMAVIFAAGWAAVSVGIIPPPAPAAAAVQNSKHDLLAAGKSERRHHAPLNTRPAAWRLGRLTSFVPSRRMVHKGVSAPVRVVTVDKPAKGRIQTAQR